MTLLYRSYHYLCRCFIPEHCIFILSFQFKTFPEMKNLSVVTMGEVYEAKHPSEINTGDWAVVEGLANDKSRDISS